MLRIVLPLLALCATACASPSATPSVGEIDESRGFFVVYGDTRTRLPYEVWRAPADRERRLVIQRIAEEEPGFVLNSGDLVAQGDSAAHWALFDRETAPLRDRGIAYLAGIGNHDLTGDDDRALRHFFARFPLVGGRRWYDVRYRGLVLLVLDSNLSDLTSAEVAAQEAWIEERLDAFDRDDSVRWISFVTHYPAFTNAPLHVPSLWVRERVLAAAREHPKVRAVISGHVHAYERFFEQGLHFVVSGGGGAPLAPIRSRGEFRDVYAAASGESDPPRGFHYCRVTVEDDEVRVEVVMLVEEGSWSVVDEFTVR